MIYNPEKILKQYWGFDNFKGSQKKVITQLLEGNDVLALLPTGGGKSICYQVPVLSMNGICIVVSPLIALIEDQVNNLKKRGIKAIALTGGIPFSEVNDLLDNCLYGNYKFLYLSPERLQQDLIKDRIRQMNVNLIAIDEAHCISQWGNDFRPAYLHCSILKELVPNTPIVALTATAKKKVALEIKENLKIKDCITIKDSFSRDNISYQIIWHQDRIQKLHSLIIKAKSSCIVYVRNRKLTHELTSYLFNKGCTAMAFHGGMSQKEKGIALKKWLTNNVQTIVATNAFGMGIDKPDVELVVHYQIPDSIESYYQEAGRAGRNGDAAKAIILVNKNAEEQVKNQFLSTLPSVNTLKNLYQKLNSFFQIAYGEGNDETFQFSFNKFCETYSLNPLLAYNGLRMLDQNSVISVSENFSSSTSIQFIATKNHLFQYLQEHTNSANVIQTILRTYAQLFEYQTKINISLISKKSETTEFKVKTILKQLENDQLIEYQENTGDIELTFLVPREDARTINRFAEKIKTLSNTKLSNIETILAYINNDTTCRNRQLLHYFDDEKKENCGKCDVCIKRKGITIAALSRVEQDILHSLAHKQSTSIALIHDTGHTEAIVLQSIQNLLENEKIEINSKNEYLLK